MENERACSHCGRVGATAWAAGVHLCHTDDPGRPDCYRRVTVWAEPVGALLELQPKPAGTSKIIRPESTQPSGDEADALAELVTLTEELGLYGTAAPVRYPNPCWCCGEECMFCEPADPDGCERHWCPACKYAACPACRS